MAELQSGPPYACKLLKPSNGKNPVETEKNGKSITKTYTFDITKFDEIFDLLVADGKIVVPQGLKITHLNKRRKEDFVNFIIFLVIKLFNVLFSWVWCRKL